VPLDNDTLRGPGLVKVGFKIQCHPQSLSGSGPQSSTVPKPGLEAGTLPAFTVTVLAKAGPARKATIKIPIKVTAPYLFISVSSIFILATIINFVYYLCTMKYIKLMK
jgi:hypothetical protein